MRKRKRYTKGLKDSVLQRITADGVSVFHAAFFHGIPASTIYQWLYKAGAKAKTTYRKET